LTAWTRPRPGTIRRHKRRSTTFVQNRRSRGRSLSMPACNAGFGRRGTEAAGKSGLIFGIERREFIARSMVRRSITTTQGRNGDGAQRAVLQSGALCPRPRLSRPKRRTVSLQSAGNLWAASASDIERPTDLDWVGFCFEAEISRCALDSCMAQERSNCLQIASAFQNVESLRPA
jgi:hypothetical protein